jgi:hypothetical protein
VVGLSGPSATTVSVTAATQNGTATADGDDAAPAPATVTFVPGEVVQVVARYP